MLDALSLSSCESEIRATNMAKEPIMESIKMRILLDEIDGNIFTNEHPTTNPYSIVADIPTEILEDNRSTIDWSKHNANSTKMKHLERD